jgi:four helix bundle protein
MENEEKDLGVRTKVYARRVIRVYAALPKSTVAQVLGKQLLRSGTSVGANYREADRARSKAEFLAKMGDSLKELAESEYWIELLGDENCVPAKRLAPLLDETRQLIAIFVTIINKGRGRDV